MRTLRVACLAAIAIATAACRDSDSAADGTASAAGRIGVVLPIATQPEYRTLEDALRKALDDAGHQLVVERGLNDASQQAALVQRFTAQKALGLVIAPLDSTSLRPSVGAAVAAGIPVFTVGLPVPGARVTTHVEPDYFAAGVVAAEYVAAFLGRTFNAGIVGRLDAHGSRELIAGFRSIMAVDSARVYSGAAESRGTSEGGAAAAEALLEQDASLDAIFALDAPGAQGAMGAALSRRRADLVIVSYGATAATLDAVRESRPLRAAVVPRLDEAARLLSEAIATQLGGDPVTASIKAPVRLVNVDSVRAGP